MTGGCNQLENSRVQLDFPKSIPCLIISSRDSFYRLKEIRKKTKQKKAQLREIQNVLDVVDTDGNDMTIDDFKSEMKDSAGGLTLEQVFKKADINSDMKLSPAERSALKKSLENRKMEIIQDMVNYQEAQLGQSFEQVAKFFADKTASKEEVNQAFTRLIRLENCIRTVTERIRAMAEKLESVEEAKSKRPDRLATLLENMVANVSAVEKKSLETEDDMIHGAGVGEEDATGHPTDGVRKRSQGGISRLLRSPKKKGNEEM
ncbi:TRP-like ion channel Pkd2 [Sparganum proliferum]